MTRRDPIGHNAPPFALPPEPQASHAWGWPLTPAGVMKAIEAFRAIPGGEPSNWRDAAIFLIGSAWGVMLTLGLLLAVQP